MMYGLAWQAHLWIRQYSVQQTAEVEAASQLCTCIEFESEGFTEQGLFQGAYRVKLA